MDFTLGKIVHFTTYDVIDKKPKTFISSKTLFRGILVVFTLGKLGNFTNNDVIDKTTKTYTSLTTLSH